MLPAIRVHISKVYNLAFLTAGVAPGSVIHIEYMQVTSLLPAKFILGGCKAREWRECEEKRPITVTLIRPTPMSVPASDSHCAPGRPLIGRGSLLTTP